MLCLRDQTFTRVANAPWSHLSVVVLLFVAAACGHLSPGPPSPPLPIANHLPPSKTHPKTRLTPDSLRKEMDWEINMFANSGFYDSAAFIEAVSDMFYNENVDTAGMINMVILAYHRKKAEQHSWPRKTDFDRLVSVFDQLNSSGIIALHNAGNSTREGREDAIDVMKELQQEHILCRGFCCYDTQDVDGAIEGHSLYINFGDFDDNDKTCVAIGKEINRLLSEQGFRTTWDQTCDSRILIKPIDWKKRFGNANCSYDHSRALLRKNRLAVK